MDTTILLDELLAKLTQVEQLLQVPNIDGHFDKANTLAISIARSAPNGNISNLAMRVMSAAIDLRKSGRERLADGDLDKSLGRLRSALDEAKSDLAGKPAPR